MQPNETTQLYQPLLPTLLPTLSPKVIEIIEDEDVVIPLSAAGLAINADSAPATLPSPKKPATNPILIKTAAFSLNSLFTAIHIASHGKMLAMLGEEGAGALVPTYLAVIIGACIGVPLSVGLHMGSLIGKEEFIEAGEMAKSGWVLSSALGATASGLMVATRGLFPLFCEPKTAQAAADFFLGYAPSCIPILMMNTGIQIAFQTGDWYVPPLTSLLFAGTSIASEYLLAFPGKLGPFGVGLGGTVSATAVSLAMQAWLLKANYKKYRLYSRSISRFCEKISMLLKNGLNLSLQRLTEWGNLMLITTVIGIGDNNKGLSAAEPSIQYLGLLGAALQGIAQATGMLITRNKGVIEQAKRQGNEAEAKARHQANKRILLLNNIATAVAEAGIAVSFYFARSPLVNFLLTDSTEPEVRELAETLLWVNAVGLIPDAVRTVSGGGLRGWQDIFYPTMVSLLSMIVFGIPAGWGLSRAFGDEEQMLFYLRNLAMLVAGSIISIRCYKKLSADAADIAASFSQTDVETNAGQANGDDEPSSHYASSYSGSFFKGAANRLKRCQVEEVIEAETETRYETSYQAHTS